MWFPCDHNSDRFHMSPTDRGHVAEASPIVTIIWKPGLSVNELIKLDQAMMVLKIQNEQCPETLKQSSTKDLRFQNMKQGERITCRYCRYQDLG